MPHYVENHCGCEVSGFGTKSAPYTVTHCSLCRKPTDVYPDPDRPLDRWSTEEIRRQLGIDRNNRSSAVAWLRGTIEHLCDRVDTLEIDYKRQRSKRQRAEMEKIYILYGLVDDLREALGNEQE